MLIAAGLIAAFAIIFGSGPKQELMLLKIDKYVKEYVVDESKKTLILSELKEVKELNKSYKKTAKGQAKKLKEMLKDPTTTGEAINIFFNTVKAEEVAINKAYMSHRILVQKSLSQEEWDNITNEMQKKFSKNDKNIQKIIKGFDKGLDKAKKSIVKEIKDEEQQGKADILLTQYLSTSKEEIEKIMEFDPKGKEILLNKHATEADLMGIVYSDIDRWDEIFDEFVTLYKGLHEICTPEEWKGVSKKLNKFLI